MVVFTCNVCGAYNQVEEFRTEPASCACGSNVRVRALVHLLSIELFGQAIHLTQFPKLPAIRGLGMTDKKGYAEILASKFSYTNTFYDREPRLDFRESHPDLKESFDFILSADVLEHVAPPVERTMDEIRCMLKPGGFLVATVPCTHNDRMREHFPELHEYRIVFLEEGAVLVNRRRDGVVEVRQDLVFHGGSGATLEMRQFGLGPLKAKLLASGFQEVEFFLSDVPECGILFDEDVSKPLVARKSPFAFDREAQLQLAGELRVAQERARRSWERAEALSEKLRLASKSRWVRLGRTIGLGPRL